MIVIPAIDLRGGRAVRLVRGNPAEETEYSADPVEVAERFQEEGARRLHVVDLDAALEQGSNTDVVKAICHAVAIPVQVGGGIRSLESIGAMLEQGAARAILGTAAAATDAAFVARAVEEFAEHVVVSLDVRGGHLMTHHPTFGLTDVFAATIPSVAFAPGVHVNYAETVLPMKDGLPKLRDFPKELGGSGEAMVE